MKKKFSIEIETFLIQSISGSEHFQQDLAVRFISDRLGPRGGQLKVFSAVVNPVSKI